MAKIIKINPKEPEETVIEEAVRIIKEGGLVALPTETVYGLACDIKNESAVRQVFLVKRRPLSEGLIVGIKDISDLYQICEEIPALAIELFKRYSPGPITCILKKKPSLSLTLSGHRDNIAVRIPRSPVALKIIERSKTFLTLTSANRHGEKSPLTAEDVIKSIGEEIDLILDGGKTEIGKESTIVDLTQTPPRILREGAIGIEEIKKVIGWVVS
ncbi:MAG: L-threonylcarbamoyladenylate synthase [candidate division WOR-3 bacterium]